MHGNLAVVSQPAWYPDWRGQTCAVVGSGPSTCREIVEALRGRCRVIVINRNYELAPWADVLYACDGRFWDWYPQARSFAGLKVTYDAKAAKAHRLHRIDLLHQDDARGNTMVLDHPGVIGRGQNGGFQATNLALQFGSRKIMVLLDYSGERWHGSHVNRKDMQRPSTLEKWRKLFDAQAVVLAAVGADVVCIAAQSSLTAFPKMDVETALRRWGCQ